MTTIITSFLLRRQQHSLLISLTLFLTRLISNRTRLILQNTWPILNRTRIISESTRLIPNRTRLISENTWLFLENTWLFSLVTRLIPNRTRLNSFKTNLLNTKLAFSFLFFPFYLIKNN